MDTFAVCMPVLDEDLQARRTKSDLTEITESVSLQRFFLQNTDVATRTIAFDASLFWQIRGVARKNSQPYISIPEISFAIV